MIFASQSSVRIKEILKETPHIVPGMLQVLGKLYVPGHTHTHTHTQEIMCPHEYSCHLYSILL